MIAMMKNHFNIMEYILDQKFVDIMLMENIGRIVSVPPHNLL